MLRTCTLANDVTIGWSNSAKEREFRTWIARRMASGYSYSIIEAAHTLIYNNATKINLGVRASEIRSVIRSMAVDFLTSGDISIVRVQKLHHAHRLAETAQAVLEHDTVEFEPY